MLDCQSNLNYDRHAQSPLPQIWLHLTNSLISCSQVTHGSNFFKSVFLSWTEKACDWMVQAASGVKSDRFLARQLFPNSDEVDVERLSVLYFLKVIQVRFSESIFSKKNFTLYYKWLLLFWLRGGQFGPQRFILGFAPEFDSIYSKPHPQP